MAAEALWVNLPSAGGGKCIDISELSWKVSSLHLLDIISKYFYNVCESA